MATEETKRVAAYVLSKRFVTKEQLQRCLALQEKAQEPGHSPALLEVLVAQGMITKSQAETISSQKGSKSGTSRRVVEIKGYRIVSRVGRGGMGAVFKAKHLALDRDVALKILPPRLAKDETFVERFVREARSAAKLNHPNIVQALDAGQSGELYYFAMEYVDGQSFDDILKERGPLPASEVIEVGQQMASALQHAEPLGLIHRDIKPGNILLTADGTAKLADFGLAKEASDTSVTHTGVTAMGTPNYVSPEQAAGERDLDIRSDVYSLGVTLYHLATGSVPFEGETAAVVMTKHLNEDPTPPRELAPAVPEALNKVILKMMEKEKEDRYQSAAELAADLAALAAGDAPPSIAPAPAPPRRPRGRRAARKSRAPLLVAAASILVLAGLAVMLARRSPEKPPAPPEEHATETPRATVPTPQDPRPRAPEKPTTPAPTPTPKSPTRNPGTDRMKNLEAMWKYAQKSATDNPENYEKHLRDYRAIEEAGPGTKYQIMARDAIERTRRAMRQKALAALQALQKRAAALAANREFGKALELFTRPPAALSGEEWQGQVEQARQDLQRQALAAFQAERAQAQQLAAEGRFAEAKAKLSATLAYGLDTVRKDALKALAELGEKQRAAQSRLHEEAEAKYAEVLKQAQRAAGELELEKAIAILDGARSAAEFAGIKDTIEADRRDFDVAGQVLRSAQEGAATLKGQQFTVRGIRGTVTEVANGKISIRSGSIVMAQPFEKLLPREIVSLAARKLDPEAAATRKMFGIYHLVTGQLTEASTELAAARLGGEDVARYQERTREAVRGARETEAERLFDRARTARREGQRPLAEKLFAQLEEEYGSTELLAAKRREIQTLLQPGKGPDEVDESDEDAAADLKSLFAGSCSELDGGRVKLTYDFSDKEQLSDWTCGQRGDRPPWGIAEGVLASTGYGSLTFNAPFIGDVELDVRLAKTSRFRAILLAPSKTDSYRGYSFDWSCYERTETRYVPVTDFGGGTRSVRITRCYVTASARVGSGATLLRKNATLGDFNPQKPYTLSMVRKGAKLSYLLNQKVMDSGLDPAQTYKSGYITLYNQGSAVYVGDLRIVGTLDPQWLSGRLATRRTVATVATSAKTAKWTDLFDGKSIANWTSSGGSWTVEGGEILANCESAGLLCLADESWKDYVFQAKFKLEIGTRCGLMVRLKRQTPEYSPSGTGCHYVSNCYQFGFAGVGVAYPTYRALGRSGSSTSIRGAFKPGANRWHEVTCTAKGNDIQLQIDGKDVRHTLYMPTDARERLSSGAVGLFCYQDTRARFKDVRIKLLSKYK